MIFFSPGTLFCVYILSQRLNVQDSAIGALAAISRIASCFMFAFAPTRPWYYSAPILNIFSHTGLTAIRSIASKSVPTEEVGKKLFFFFLMTNLQKGGNLQKAPSVLGRN